MYIQWPSAVNPPKPNHHSNSHANRFPPGPPPWAPTTKTGLQFWFKADFGISQAGNLISSWLDANGGTAATESGAARPTYVPVSLNGLPGVSFPAGTSLDFGTATPFTHSAPFSLVLVVKETAGAGTWYQAAFTILSSAAGRSLSGFFTNDASYADFAFGEYPLVSGPAIKAATDFTSAAAAMVINYNGADSSTPSSWTLYNNNASQALSSSANGMVLATRNKLGSWFGGDLSLNGIIYEIFAYNTELTADERTQVETYLSTKWGI